MTRLLTPLAFFVALTGLLGALLGALVSDAAASHDHIVTVKGRIESFDTGHDRSFLLRTRRGRVEVFVGQDTRVAVDGELAAPGDLRVGMRAHVSGVIAHTDAHHKALRARTVRAFTPPDHGDGH